MPPSLPLSLAALLAWVLAALGVLWYRVRSLPVAETAQRVEDLARRQCALEELVAHLVAEGARQRAEGTKPGHAGSSEGPIPSTPRRRIDGAERSAINGPTLIAVPNLGSPSSTSNAAATAELGRRFGAIWDRADAGAPIEAIARDTGYPVGQVELILGLRRQLATVATPGSRA